MLPIPKFYNSADTIEQTIHDFGACDAGAYKPDIAGLEIHLWNDKGFAGSDAMTSVRLSVRDDDGGEDKVWTKQCWIEIKSNGVGPFDNTILTTDVDIATEIITVAIDFFTGQEIKFTTTNTLPAPLVIGTLYYAIRVDATHIKVATSLANANAGTAINLTDVGVGTHTVKAYSVDDAMTAFVKVGLNHELSLGDIPKNCYRILYVRLHTPTDAEEQNIAFQLRAKYQDPVTDLVEVIMLHFQDVRATKDDYIHTAIIGTGAVQEITTGITNPDICRNASIKTTNVATPSGIVKLDGVNNLGQSASEEITIVAGSTIYGNVAWATISKITVPAGVKADDSVTVGISDKIGLITAIDNVNNVFKKKVNNEDKTSEIPNYVNKIYHTLDCTKRISAVAFTGTGLDDATSGGIFTGLVDTNYKVQIDGKNGIKTSTLGAGGTGYAADDTFTVNTGSVLATGKVLTVNADGVVLTYSILTSGSGYTVADGVATTKTSGAGTGLTINITALHDTFKWSDDGGATWDATVVAITASAQTLNNGVTVTFGAIVGHTLTDYWTFVAYLGIVANEEVTIWYIGRA